MSDGASAEGRAGRATGAPLTVCDVMDRDTVRAVLASVAPGRRGSRLDPYVPLIRALRRGGRSYRAIVAVLHERCGIRVGLHTLYHFVQTRARRRTKGSAGSRRMAATRSSALRTHATAAPTLTGDESHVRARIAALKQRPIPAAAAPTKEFHYDENEPLRLATDRRPQKRDA